MAKLKLGTTIGGNTPITCDSNQDTTFPGNIRTSKSISMLSSEYAGELSVWFSMTPTDISYSGAVGLSTRQTGQFYDNVSTGDMFLTADTGSIVLNYENTLKIGHIQVYPEPAVTLASFSPSGLTITGDLSVTGNISKATATTYGGIKVSLVGNTLTITV
jgi:hypothetical protein